MRAHFELCGRCGHPLDHPGKPCLKAVVLTDADGEKNEPSICGCPFGVRTDVFLNQQLATVIKQQHATIERLEAVGAAIFDVGRILLAAHRLEVDDEGNIRTAAGIVRI